MNAKHKSELVHDINPEWTIDDFANAKQASQVLAQIFNKAVAIDMPKPLDKFNTDKTAVAT